MMQSRLSRDPDTGQLRMLLARADAESHSLQEAEEGVDNELIEREDCYLSTSIVVSARITMADITVGEAKYSELSSAV